MAGYLWEREGFSGVNSDDQRSVGSGVLFENSDEALSVDSVNGYRMQ